MKNVWGSSIAFAKNTGKRWDYSGRVLFIVNNDRAIVTHRSTWVSVLISAGAEVHVAAEDTGSAATLRGLGAKFHDLRLGREKNSAIEDLVALFSTIVLIARVRPNVVVLLATRAYSLGWIPGVLLRRTTFIRVITGAGRVLTEMPDRTAGKLVKVLLRAGSRLKNVHTLFQTESDQELFLGAHLAHPDRSSLLEGTGVVVEDWPDVSSMDRPVSNVLFASRLFEEKGVREFVSAAEILREEFDNVTFRIAGAPDSGVSSAIEQEELLKWQEDGHIQLEGYVTDLDRLIGECDILVLPSRHAEGTPRVLIEAGAAGLARVASDIDGCRAVITDNADGLIVPPGDADALASALRGLIQEPELCRQLGKAARVNVTNRFGLDTVLRKFMVVVGAVAGEESVAARGEGEDRL